MKAASSTNSSFRSYLEGYSQMVIWQESIKDLSSHKTFKGETSLGVKHSALLIACICKAVTVDQNILHKCNNFLLKTWKIYRICSGWEDI